MYKSTKNFSTMFATNKNVQNVINHAHYLLHLEQIMQPYLPKAAQNNCHIAKFEDRILLLIASNASIRTKLYYQQHNLIAKLKKHIEFITIMKVDIKVIPQEEKINNSKLPIPVISKTDANCIKQGIRLIKTKEIKQAFKQLIKRSIDKL